jgi:hypothetical protein
MFNTTYHNYVQHVFDNMLNDNNINNIIILILLYVCFPNWSLTSSMVSLTSCAPSCVSPGCVRMNDEKHVGQPSSSTGMHTTSAIAEGSAPGSNFAPPLPFVTIGRCGSSTKMEFARRPTTIHSDAVLAFLILKLQNHN